MKILSDPECDLSRAAYCHMGWMASSWAVPFLDPEPSSINQILSTHSLGQNILGKGHFQALTRHVFTSYSNPTLEVLYCGTCSEYVPECPILLQNNRRVSMRRSSCVCPVDLDTYRVVSAILT